MLIGDARGRGEPYGTKALGAVFLDARQPVAEFSVTPVDAALKRFLPLGRGHRINEAETLWVWVALQTWGRHLEGADVTIVIDSSAAEGVIRKGMSGSVTLCCLSAEVWREVRLRGARLRVVRIPSEANPADPLSRLVAEPALARGSQQVAAVTPAQWHFDPRSRGR